MVDIHCGISMVFVYTGVFSEYNTIIHYNSVKKIHGMNF